MDYLSEHGIGISGHSYDRDNPGARPTYDSYRIGLSQSLIGLNFTWKGSEDVLVSRTWEILSSGVLLLQNESQVFGDLFIPGVHFLEFKSKEHLLGLLHELTSNPNLIEKIARAGMERYIELYSNEEFWKKVI